MSNVKPISKIELNPMTGEFDLVSGNNFSYLGVPTDKKLKIPANMQMAVHGTFEVDGYLELEGQLVIEP